MLQCDSAWCGQCAVCRREGRVSLKPSENHAVLHQHDAQVIKLCRTLQELEQKLESHQFNEAKPSSNVHFVRMVEENKELHAENAKLRKMVGEQAKEIQVLLGEHVPPSEGLSAHSQNVVDTAGRGMARLADAMTDHTLEGWQKQEEFGTAARGVCDHVNNLEKRLQRLLKRIERQGQ